jgi:hypothetical protein
MLTPSITTLVEGDAVLRYAPQRAAFRTYLKSLLKHFVLHHDEALGCLKRGGGARLAESKGDVGELVGAIEDPQGLDPERIFERLWKGELIRCAEEQVREWFSAEGRALQFKVFEEYSGCDAEEKPT